MESWLQRAAIGDRMDATGASSGVREENESTRGGAGEARSAAVSAARTADEPIDATMKRPVRGLRQGSAGERAPPDLPGTIDNEEIAKAAGNGAGAGAPRPPASVLSASSASDDDIGEVPWNAPFTEAERDATPVMPVAPGSGAGDVAVGGAGGAAEPLYRWVSFNSGRRMWEARFRSTRGETLKYLGAFKSKRLAGAAVDFVSLENGQLAENGATPEELVAAGRVVLEKRARDQRVPVKSLDSAWLDTLIAETRRNGSTAPAAATASPAAKQKQKGAASPAKGRTQNTSRRGTFKGVSYNKRVEKYEARVRLPGGAKYCFYGSYKTPRLAAAAVDAEFISRGEEPVNGTTEEERREAHEYRNSRRRRKRPNSPPGADSPLPEAPGEAEGSRPPAPKVAKVDDKQSSRGAPSDSKAGESGSDEGNDDEDEDVADSATRMIMVLAAEAARWDGGGSLHADDEWLAQINVNGSNVSLGTFETAEEARACTVGAIAGFKLAVKRAEKLQQGAATED